jgi:succinate dehydrogenase/fumarate reductase flavoprotein subunit
MANFGNNVISCDVLIIGSGIAGMCAAFEVSRSGKKPLLVSKAPFGKANNTCLAGGLFSFSTEGFDLDKHIEKTLFAGRELNDRALVNRFTKEAPFMVRELKKMGMRGTVQKGGMTTRTDQILGGPEIVSSLVRVCRGAGVNVMEGIMITDLIIKDQTCHGAIGFKKRTGEIYAFKSDAVVLATGGAGSIYAQNDNAPGITGDGYILALDAGLELVDMEFVQFYPLVYAGSGKARVIIPPLFADRGKITNRSGEDLKEKYGLHEKPLAIVSRDKLSQALFREIIQKNDVNGALLLDMRNVDDAQIPLKEGLKGTFKRKFSYDSKPIKISPACHHTMGGVPIDDSGGTALGGLFAAGEVVGGIHGANRMGGNALTESLVFGVLSARSAAAYAGPSMALPQFEALAKDTAKKRFDYLSEENTTPVDMRHLRGEIGRILWEKAGIIRDERSLKESIEGMNGIFRELEGHRASSPRAFYRALACRNAALTGSVISVSALRRTESRGSHYRSDFPVENKDWIKHIHVKKTEGRPQVARISPVV